MRTPFFASVGGHVGEVDEGTPVGELLSHHHAGMTAMEASAQSSDSVPRGHRIVSANPSPALRHPVSDEARATAAQKVVDTIERSIPVVTVAFLQH